METIMDTIMGTIMGIEAGFRVEKDIGSGKLPG